MHKKHLLYILSIILTVIQQSFTSSQNITYDEYGYTKLHVAAKIATPETFEKMLQENPHLINARSSTNTILEKPKSFDRTVGHVAIFHNKLELLTLWIAYGGNPNIQDCQGTTVYNEIQKQPAHKNNKSFKFQPNQKIIQEAINAGLRQNQKLLNITQSLYHVPAGGGAHATLTRSLPRSSKIENIDQSFINFWKNAPTDRVYNPFTLKPPMPSWTDSLTEYDQNPPSSSKSTAIYHSRTNSQTSLLSLQSQQSQDNITENPPPPYSELNEAERPLYINDRFEALSPTNKNRP